jgi:SAM-dependent methyltransferase
MLSRIINAMRNSYIHPRYLAQREITRIILLEEKSLHGKLLDVGCGRKPYRQFVSQVKEYIGLDVPSTIHNINNADVVGSSLALPFKNNYFDSILCTEVLEHIPEPLVALQEVARVTKQGGSLLITVPMSEQLHEEPYDFYRFTQYSLVHLLDKSGWKMIRLYKRGGTWLELGYRFSSFIYSTIGAQRTPSGYLKRRFLLAPLVALFCALIQIVVSCLDSVWKSDLSTIGFGILAQKE